VIEGGEKKFAGSYSKVIKAKFLPPEAWRLHESVKDMPVPEIIALLNSEDKIGDANVKDIVLTALGREGRINRGEAIELKEPLVMVGKDEWLYFVMTYDRSVIELINKYQIISPELERSDRINRKSTNTW